jgi:multidrug efflux pump subunit AcrA (membrane-fusion protein)
MRKKVFLMSTSTPHEGTPVAAQPLRPPARSRRLGLSTGAWIVNGMLVLALVALGIYAYTRLSSSSSANAATRTATVQRGVVTTSVSASGSVASAGDVAANFQTSGTLTALFVKQGQHVTKGHVLARVDSLSARQSVQEARAGLATAQGRLQQTLNPLNAQEKAQLAISDAAAAQSVQSATVSLSDTKAQNTQNLSQAESAVTRAKQQLASDKAQLATDKQSTAASAESALSQDEDKISSDQTAVQTAVANVAATKLKNTQSLHSAQNQVAQAKMQQQTNAAGNAVKAAPPQPGDLAAARAAVLQAQIALAQARKALRETTLRAPISGVVATVDGSVGDAVSGGGGNGSSSSDSSSSSSSAASSSNGSSSSSSSSLITITGRNKLQVVAGFSEGDAASIKVGEPATAAISALPGVTLGAKVIAIDSTATTVSNVVTYNVTFALTGGNAKLKPGMTADVEVITAERDNALHVPTSAVTGSGANARVTVLRNGQQVSTPVVAGLKGDDATEITSGLQAGDTVVLPTLTLSSSSSSSSAFGSRAGAGRLRAAGGFGGGGLGGP